MKRLLLACAAWVSGSALAETQVIHAGRVITEAGKPALGESTITVTDGRIVSIAAGRRPAPAGATVIDLHDKTVLPGLVDAHVHLSGDPGGDFWKEAVEPDVGQADGVEHTAARLDDACRLVALSLLAGKMPTSAAAASMAKSGTSRAISPRSKTCSTTLPPC